MAKSKRILWGRVFSFVGILLMVFVVVLFSTNMIPSTTLIRSILSPRAAAVAKPINVLEIRYIPYDIVNQRAKTNALSTALVAEMNEASKYRGYKDTTALPYSQVVIKRTIERNVPAPNTPGAHELWYDSLNTILTGSGENLCDYIVANKIDQVWGWFDVANDRTGGYDQEFARFYSNALLPQDAYGEMCGGRRSFIFLGLDQGTDIGNTLHSFGHSMESLMSKVEGTDLFWNKWVGLTTAEEGGLANRCGDVHYPPNGRVLDGLGYDYNNTANITTTCENWKPDGTGTATTINCVRWGCTQEGYMKWWLQNAPNANNGLTYQGRALPNWWDLLSDTDNAIGTAAFQGQYMTTQFLDASRPPNFDFSSKKWQDSGLSMTFSHPTAGTNRLMLISASYISQGSAKTDGGGIAGARLEQIQDIKVGTTTLTAAANRVNRTINGQYATELWYMVAPPVATNTVTVNFTNTFVNNENVAITTLTGVNQTTPFASATGASAFGSSLTPTITIPSTTSQLLFGVVSMYTGSNTLTVSGNTRGIAGTNTMNVIGKSAVAIGGPTAGLSWTGTTAWPWSISAAAINLITGLPTPTPTPTPKATSFTLTGPTSGTVGVASTNFTVTPVGGPYTGTITITPSGTGATGLTAKTLTFSNSQVAQTFTITPTVAGSITLTPSNNGAITNPAALTYTSVTATSNLPTVDLKMNKVDAFFWDTSLKTFAAQTFTLSWTSTNATSCMRTYGDWLMTGTALPTSGTVALGTGSTTVGWAISCTGPNGTATDFTRAIGYYPLKGVNQNVVIFANNVDTTGYDATSKTSLFAGTPHPLIIKSGTNLTLSWFSQGVTSCTASDGWTGAKAVNVWGSQAMGAATASKTYTLKCVYGTTTASASAVVVVK